MLANRFRTDHACAGVVRGPEIRRGARAPGAVLLARALMCSAILLGLLTGAALAQAVQAGGASERTVLDIGGRVIAFEARPVTVTSFTLPFEAGNALLLQDAQQRLRQPDLGPFGSSNGTVLHIVSVSGGDRKLAFERARTIRAALVRLGVADPRGLAAAAAEGETATDTAASAVDARIETITVTVSRLTRASCPACSASTLGTAAMDTGSVRLATMETGRSASLAAAAPVNPAASTARTADRREPDTNLSFTDRPALATDSRGPGISQEDARALGTVAAAAAAAAPPSPERPGAAARNERGRPRTAARNAAGPTKAAAAPVAVAHGERDGAAMAPRVRIGPEAVRRADLNALGLSGAAGCRPRAIVIDDYLPPRQGWQCGRR